MYNRQQAKALETQWRSGVVLSSLKSCPEASVAQAAAYVIENWQVGFALVTFSSCSAWIITRTWWPRLIS